VLEKFYCKIKYVVGTKYKILIIKHEFCKKAVNEVVDNLNSF